MEESGNMKVEEKVATLLSNTPLRTSTEIAWFSRLTSRTLDAIYLWLEILSMIV